MPRGNNSEKKNPDWKSHSWAGTTFICAKLLLCMQFPLMSDIIYRFITLAVLLKTRKLPLRLQIVVALSDPWQSIVPIWATLKQPGTGTRESLLTPVCLLGLSSFIMFMIHGGKVANSRHWPTGGNCCENIIQADYVNDRRMRHCLKS